VTSLRLAWYPQFVVEPVPDSRVVGAAIAGSPDIPAPGQVVYLGVRAWQHGERHVADVVYRLFPRVPIAGTGPESEEQS
jgi:hypothetical protein